MKTVCSLLLVALVLNTVTSQVPTGDATKCKAYRDALAKAWSDYETKVENCFAMPDNRLLQAIQQKAEKPGPKPEDLPDKPVSGPSGECPEILPKVEKPGEEPKKVTCEKEAGAKPEAPGDEPTKPSEKMPAPTAVAQPGAEPKLSAKEECIFDAYQTYQDAVNHPMKAVGFEDADDAEDKCKNVTLTSRVLQAVQPPKQSDLNAKCQGIVEEGCGIKNDETHPFNKSQKKAEDKRSLQAITNDTTCNADAGDKVADCAEAQTVLKDRSQFAIQVDLSVQNKCSTIGQTKKDRRLNLWAAKSRVLQNVVTKKPSEIISATKTGLFTATFQADLLTAIKNWYKQDDRLTISASVKTKAATTQTAHQTWQTATDAYNHYQAQLVNYNSNQDEWNVWNAWDSKSKAMKEWETLNQCAEDKKAWEDWNAQNVKYLAYTKSVKDNQDWNQQTADAAHYKMLVQEWKDWQAKCDAWKKENPGKACTDDKPVKPDTGKSGSYQSKVTKMKNGKYIYMNATTTTTQYLADCVDEYTAIIDRANNKGVCWTFKTDATMSDDDLRKVVVDFEDKGSKFALCNAKILTVIISLVTMFALY